MTNGIPKDLKDLFISYKMKDFDRKSFSDKVSKYLENYRLPATYIAVIVASSQKDLEDLIIANRVAFEGLESIALRQAEILQETMSEATKGVEAIAKAGSPPEAAAKQAELVKASFETALANMRELAEIVTKANQEAAQAVSARVSESLGELRDLTSKLKGA